MSIMRPLYRGSAMDGYKHADIGRYLGREYADIQIRELLKDPDVDAKLRDLAIISKFHHLLYIGMLVD